MKRILVLFQIKTIRSAWVFLVGSVLLFAFGAYQALTSPAYPHSDPRGNFAVSFFSIWFVVLGIYIAVASWALFFACYAAAFATVMLLGVLSLPFVGFVGIEAMFSPGSGIYLLFAALVWSPLIYRYLK